VSRARNIYEATMMKQCTTAWSTFIYMPSILTDVSHR